MSLRWMVAEMSVTTRRHDLRTPFILVSLTDDPWLPAPDALLPRGPMHRLGICLAKVSCGQQARLSSEGISDNRGQDPEFWLQRPIALFILPRHFNWFELSLLPI
jgi:hypothetical protein